MPYILLDPKHDSDGKRGKRKQKPYECILDKTTQVFSEPMNIS